MYKELREVTAQLTGEGGPFEITTVEIDGLHLRTYKNAPADMRQVWLGTAGHGDADYLVYQEERLSYGEAHQLVAAAARNLVDRFGVKPGDRIAIAMRNYPEWVLAYWAAISVGASVVGMNAWWTGPEMAYALDDAKPTLLIADKERLERLESVRDQVGEFQIVAVRMEAEAPAGSVPWSELVAGGGTLPDVEIEPDSDACIFYTSGTTGRPKGAQLTHRGCTNNIMSMAFWNSASPAALAAAGRKAEPTADATSYPPCFLVVTPLFHVTACNCVMHGASLTGGKLILMYKWEAGRALELIEKERVTTISGVPVMSRELIAHENFITTDTSSLKSLGGGGAAIQPDLVEKIEAKVSSARPGTGYGMTEACGVITMNSADFFLDKPETAGPILPVFETLIEGADGRPVTDGGVGELCVRGAQVIRGYLNRPEATAESITNGWLHTGDIAKIDEDGFVAIVDRAKDMLLRGGENVYCAEVEAAIFEHDAVAECAVIGVADDRLGEEVGAAVVLAEGASIEADALRAFVKERIAAFKVPRYIWFLDTSLPRNASGKFMKPELRKTLDSADAV
ncbi:MAG: class I adenylate-forming enzyme family protein [Candidatus Binatia bacterium]|nr:class I adenylate-forming enzyme family protein [Candidatus Binatia bacterium]